MLQWGPEQQVAPLQSPHSPQSSMQCLLPHWPVRQHEYSAWAFGWQQQVSVCSQEAQKYQEELQKDLFSLSEPRAGVSLLCLLFFFIWLILLLSGFFQACLLFCLCLALNDCHLFEMFLKFTKHLLQKTLWREIIYTIYLKKMIHKVKYYFPQSLTDREILLFSHLHN